MLKDIQAELTAMGTLYANIQPTLSAIAGHKGIVSEFAKAFLDARTNAVLPDLEALEPKVHWQRFHRYIEQRWGYLDGELRSMHGVRSLTWSEMTDGLEVVFDQYLGCGEYETVTTLIPARFFQGDWQTRLTREARQLTRLVARLQQRADRKAATAREAQERATLLALQAKYANEGI